MVYSDLEGLVLKLRQLNIINPKSAYVMTFGCQQNEADSERMRGILIDSGFSIKDSYEGADVIIVNTCAIRQHAEMKVLSMLGNFKSEKRANPDLIVGVVGCMAAEDHIVRLLKTKFHYVSFTLTPGLIHTLPEVLFSLIEGEPRRFLKEGEYVEIVEGVPTARLTKHRAWIPIMYGCNNFCSYCIVPYTRGRERSRESKDVIADCKTAIKEGAREIFLLGQNVNSYSADINFAKLLLSISSLEGDFIVRFMTSHPKDVSDELINVMSAGSDKIAPYFHLPLQSGSNKILSLMNRTYTRERFLEIAKELRERIPGITLSTDVIIGFPGEGEDDFLDTLDILECVRFDTVFAFNFSPRSGTPASTMGGVVEAEVKDERMQRLLYMQDKISLERNLPYVGRTERVLVDSISKRSGACTYSGRTISNKLVHFLSDDSYIGEFVNIEITEARAFELIGKIKK